ncbi:DNA phosphorothioation-dependent restriction protein DptF [Bacillus litorisediminis]|uniref:DNA phosphorothioation-dependent restriction protein DptF n=1 Tax=Bacillus litorisediminis TaxID=2922713 RepID=UPI001FAF0AF3|nr:DNA phosphorothioation-dependent restriction protein DptF [Bacillus litorisediminis]
MGMQEYAVQFIEVYNKEWAELGKDFERSLFEDTEAALLKARKLMELLVKELYVLEEMEYPTYGNQAEKNMLLKNEGVLDDEIFSALDRIRRMGNSAAHGDKKIPFSDALKVHSNVYTVCKWFMESYVVDPIQTIPEYQDPKFENIDEKLKKLLAEFLPSYLGNVEGKQIEKQPRENDKVVAGTLPTLHKSHLLYQLNKLRESSQEAVEGYQELSDFKQYMHVKRPIQETLENCLQECVESPGSKLIFLCGSVGDGKSHLLGYLSTTKHELMSKFKIHNDATESFDPKKNSLDTLAEVLEPFSDEQLEHSNGKLILAINLGVLHNFIESPYAEDKYKKLKQYIEEAKVFDPGHISTPPEHKNFKLVNFADYHSFELTKEGPMSTYMSQLFSKITNPVPDNPFYAAYQADVKEFNMNPLLLNYEMFSSKSVQQQIIQLIIKTIMRDKIILSSRALLNFIYDIIVPTSLYEMRTSDIVDMLPHLLPNLLFEGGDKSPILQMLGNQDPIHYRSMELDRQLISLHNTGSYYVFFRDVIYDSSAQSWIQLLEPIENVAFLEQDVRRELSELFIRACYLYDSHLKDSFKDYVYNEYMQYLYAYNTNQSFKLQNLYYNIEKSIFLWKGSPKNGYIYLDDEGKKIRIAEPLILTPNPISISNEESEIVYRFSSTLLLGFSCEPDETVHTVEIDLPLYEMIVKVLKGYKLNKKDREDSIQFIEFIEKLLPFGKQKQEIMIKDSENQLMFRFNYNAKFQAYSFARER